jgi:UDP-N-acetylmuramoyl-L-alanyl-D-glutamate--2,6-diaminopimelate ligase
VTYPAPRPAGLPARPLAELTHALDGATVHGGALEGASVRGVTHDSRAVRPGDLYVALPGLRAHGADFAAQAVASGAVAVVTDAAGAARLAAHVPCPVPVVVTAEPRASLAALAAMVYGDPSARLTVLGVTGTNGKTTVSFLVEAGLAAAGRTTGLIGTVETRLAGERVPSVRTTPEAPDLQALLATMVERGVDAVAMEVSSHALAQHRVDAVRFAGAMFTNLSQDHLDFHPSMADYFAAKASLFDPARTAAAVVGTDGGWGRRLAARVPGAVTYAVGRSADWTAADVELRSDASTFRLRGPDRVDIPVRLRLAGDFNVSNALGALALLASVGVPLDAAVDGVAGLAGVPGRMERVDAGQPFLALVDYAHTPAAVQALLAAVRQLIAGKVVVVLGCGGDRDRGKRPLMAAAAVEGADLAVFTSDNPRSEDPAEILAQMVAGVDDADRRRLVVEPDRAAAIATAVAAARPGDAVVVAGKGHETGQDYGGVVTPFDDRVVLAEALTALVGAAS